MIAHHVAKVEVHIVVKERNGCCCSWNVAGSCHDKNEKMITFIIINNS